MARELRIEETTVADIDGWRVTAGNLMRDRFTRADGSSAEGPTIELGLYDDAGEAHGEPTVGVGSVVRIAGVDWEIVAVERPDPSDNGYVTLRSA
ncbi:MAG: hypothetical protein RIT45_2792 [Pseudomonadota bacterium]|jgi:hypothetical protein